ncbi:Holliday junction resolvase RuvX [Intestinicryptomonas porci]|uniref:Putative pre-16S rRNA nuclease n=1 Tax=Intestinicryptomonas porci TaxID=2926320 RepID=A0ABU4WHB6_9BACT|nr:Holliday junction resolvase RuvX [Opitutales bacterium CLA-KB-P66]
MKILGLDYGHKRIGLAFADELGVAFPIPAAVENSVEARLNHIALEIERRKPDMLLIGYPYNMDGSASQKMKEVDAFIEILKSRFSLPVDTSDERLSSFQAEADLEAFAPKKSRKKTVAARQKYRRSGDIDSRAIAIVLQDYIDNRPA